jgi:hypothetical protein
VKDFDLTVFRKLEKVSQPLERVALDTSNLSQSEIAQKYVEELERQTPLQAEAALGHSFSKCQIASVVQDNMKWRAEVTPELFSCQCSSTEK